MSSPLQNENRELQNFSHAANLQAVGCHRYRDWFKRPGADRALVLAHFSQSARASAASQLESQRRMHLSPHQAGHKNDVLLSKTVASSKPGTEECGPEDVEAEDAIEITHLRPNVSAR